MTSKQIFESALEKYKNGFFKDAFSLFCDSEELAGSKFYIGLSFEKGNGVEKNFEEAVKWYNEAAGKGYPAAMYRLGLCYEDGIGVPKNLHMAKYWYELGKKAGNQGASERFGKLPQLPPEETSDLIPHPTIPDIKEDQEQPDQTATTSETPKKYPYSGRPLIETRKKKKKDSMQLPDGSMSEKKLKKMSYFFLSLIGIIILGGIIIYLSSDNTHTATSTPQDHQDEESVSESNQDVIKPVIQEETKPHKEKIIEREDSVAPPPDIAPIEEEEMPAIAKDNSPIAHDSKTKPKENYKTGSIGSSRLKMYIPEFLTKSAFSGNEKIYFGYKTSRIISKAVDWSGTPEAFMRKENWAGMKPSYETVRDNWAVESGYYKDAIYYRKVKIIDGIAYYAIFHVPAKDKGNGRLYQKMTEFIFDQNNFPLNN